jgi:hypothetical protein
MLQEQSFNTVSSFVFQAPSSGIHGETVQQDRIAHGANVMTASRRFMPGAPADGGGRPLFERADPLRLPFKTRLSRQSRREERPGQRL